MALVELIQCLHEWLPEVPQGGCSDETRKIGVEHGRLRSGARQVSQDVSSERQEGAHPGGYLIQEPWDTPMHAVSGNSGRNVANEDRHELDK